MRWRSATPELPLLLTLAAILSVAACSGPGAAPRATSPATLDVFAAASLTDAFGELAGLLEQMADVDIRLTFAGSQTLRLQLEQGAGADLYASADRSHVMALQQGGIVGAHLHFASTQLALVVPAEGDRLVNGLASLERARRLVVGSAQVPVGIYTAGLFANGSAAYGQEWRAAVEASVVSRESNVRLLRAKVELGEADAGVVYRSDAIGRDRLRIVPIPESLNVAVGYYIAAVRGAGQGSAARLWIDLLMSDDGRQVLQRWGFATGAEPPEES